MREAGNPLRTVLGAGWLLLVAASAGCVAIEPRIEERVARVDEERLQAHVESLTEHGPRPVHDNAASARAVDYLRAELESYGYSVFEERFPLSGYEAVNVFASLTGSVEPESVIEVSAHYDTVPGSPGADDNTSAVAGLLEVARVLADAEPGRSVRFCLFGAEEVGLVGSGHHVKGLAELPGEVIGLLNMEMIGYSTDGAGTQHSPARIPLIIWPPRQGNFICVVGNFSSGAVGNRFEGAADRYVPELRYYSVNRIGGFFGDAARSDHFPYWNAGIPAIMLTDTAEFRNPNYHRASDVADTLDYEFMGNVVRAVVATVMEWAGEGAGESGAAG